MGDSHLLVDVVDGVATMTLNRPDKLNSLTADLVADLDRALQDAGRDPDVRCVVITGAGRAFSAGHSLEGPQLTTREILVDYYNPLATTLAGLDTPVIASINGIAAGAAASLSLACDFRIMADEARFAFLFTRVGLVADAGGTWFLPRLVGPAKATELFMLGRDVPAREAVDIGLAYRAVPRAELAAATAELADRLAQGPAAIGLFKRQLRSSADNTLDQQLALETTVQGLATKTADYREGVAAFLEKRAAQFTGR